MTRNQNRTSRDPRRPRSADDGCCPSHATSYGSDPYSVTDYQANIGSSTGTIFYTGATTFSAHLHVINAHDCGDHHTVAMFKLDFKDGTSAFTRTFENPSQL